MLIGAIQIIRETFLAYFAQKMSRDIFEPPLPLVFFSDTVANRTPTPHTHKKVTYYLNGPIRRHLVNAEKNSLDFDLLKIRFLMK
jgi:hypothetical protein